MCKYLLLTKYHPLASLRKFNPQGGAMAHYGLHVAPPLRTCACVCQCKEKKVEEEVLQVSAAARQGYC